MNVFVMYLNNLTRYAYDYTMSVFMFLKNKWILKFQKLLYFELAVLII